MEYQTYACSIQSLHLENFRGFDKFDIGFNPEMTVLTAPNGGGKSAVLQALSRLCETYIGSSCYGGVAFFPSPIHTQEDHRLVRQAGGGMTPATGEVVFCCKGMWGVNEPIKWGCSLKRDAESGVYVTSALHDNEVGSAPPLLRDLSAEYDKNPALPYPLAPLICLYDTERFYPGWFSADASKTNLDRFEGYKGCLAQSSGYPEFRDWFRRVSLKSLGETQKLIKQGKTDFSGVQAAKKLDLVRNALNIALADVGWRDAEWDNEWNEVVLTHRKQGSLPYSMLSDGIKNVFKLVADMAYRAVRLNPCADLDLFEYLNGVVLIDEIDLYLHPSWQQKILFTLRKIFPKVQFVVTTHSPQVLSTLKREEIRAITQDEDGGWHADMPNVNPYAKDAGVALAGVFNTPTAPEVAERGLMNEVELLYRAGKTAEADAKLEELRQKGVDIDESSIRFWKFLAAK